jgi:threonylcarbamoyladenosine tRNA methylthiotransferase CDKAL1
MDIEDAPVSAGYSLDPAAPPSAGLAVPRRVRNSAKRTDAATDITNSTAGSDSSPAAPAPRKVFVHTFGCGHNVSDGEYMAGQLAHSGYIVSEQFDGADCFVINSCTVKNPSEDHFVTLLNRARDTGKPVVVAGCVPQGDPNNKQWSDVSVVGVRQIDRIGYVVDEAIQGNVVRLFSTEGGTQKRGDRAAATDSIPSLALPKVRRNKLIEIVPINVGCLNFCTYCKTKHARGDLKSWPVADIVARVKQVVREGVVEIRMTSEDTGAYGIDLGTNIVELLRAAVKELEGTQVMLRLGMSNPPYLLKHLEGMCEVLKHPNVFEYLHLPVQSGSNAILGRMNREYTVEEFNRCVDTFTRAVPHMAVATDIICAFPGEGDSEWQETMALCRRWQFPYLNISRFYARRDTPAAAMKQVPTAVSKTRSVEITQLYNSYGSFNEPFVGRTCSFWVTEVAHDKHHLVGHLKEGFVQVLVDPATASLGDHVTVRITGSNKYSLSCTVMSINGRAGVLRSQGHGHATVPEVSSRSAAAAAGVAPPSSVHRTAAMKAWLSANIVTAAMVTTSVVIASVIVARWRPTGAAG